jgi:hypothetical protein
VGALPSRQTSINLPAGLASAEKKKVTTVVSAWRTEWQKKIDHHIFNLFKIPDDLRFLF